VRTWLIYRTRIDAATAVHSVILDRIAALAAVALLVVATAPLFVSRVGWGLPALLAIGLAASGLAAIVVGVQLDRMPARWMRLRPLRLLAALASAMRAVLLRPSAALPTLAFAVAAQAAMGFSAYAIAASLNLAVTPVDCLVLMQPVALLTALPISIGGWGVREGAMIGLFGLIGVPTSAVLVLSVQIGLLTILASLPGGVLWLILRRGPSVDRASDGNEAHAPGAGR
jgi:glycosyltransferase 2 family protein